MAPGAYGDRQPRDKQNSTTEGEKGDWKILKVLICSGHVHIELNKRSAICLISFTGPARCLFYLYTTCKVMNTIIITLLACDSVLTIYYHVELMTMIFQETHSNHLHKYILSVCLCARLA
jgi:hypothetical protein